MSTQPHEIDAYLGNTEASDEQREALRAASDAIEARFPGDDHVDDREEAMSAAAQVILGDDELESIAGAYLAARRVERERRAALTGALIATPGSEVALAGRAGVTRMTVRKALGK